jgi:hypothetical protein
MASVPNALKAKPSRRQYDRPLETVPLLEVEESADLFDGSVSAPNFKERSGHPPHHAAKKGRSNHVHPHLVSKRAHFEASNRSASIFNAGIELFRKRSVIVISDQGSPALPHSVHVQRAVVEVRVAGS